MRSHNAENAMLTNTKVLFASVLKALRSDCICDIGSRDGDQSILFRDLLPDAIVVAFEANRLNFERMREDPRLSRARVEVLPYAISDQNGWAQFHITDVDYSDPNENRGTSSLLVQDWLPVQQTEKVETRRIDDFLSGHHPSVRRIGLWIDVEGAEYWVLSGMQNIVDRVLAVHVETARIPLRPGQKTLAELAPLMQRFGFIMCGSNIGKTSDWGDVVFVHEKAVAALGWRWRLCQLKARASRAMRADFWAVFFKSRAPWLYHLLRRIYVRLGF
jgi:FkbM family methyltransferase